MVERTADRPYPERVSAPTRYIERPAALRRISWGAIFAGTVIAMVTHMLLGLLGVGVGATTIDPAGEGSPSGQALSMGAAIWWVVCSLIAVFLGGLVAGRLAGMPRRQDGALHGLVTWAFSTLVLVWIVASATSGIVGGAFSILGQAVQTGAIAGAAATGGQQQGQAQGQQGQGGQVMGQIGQAVQQQASELIARVTGRSDISPEDAAAAAQALAQSGGDEGAAARTLSERTGMTEEQARQAIAEWRQRGEQAGQQAAQTARQGAERTAEAVAQASIWAFVAFVLGAIAAAIGGGVGAPRDLTAEGLERV